MEHSLTELKDLLLQGPVDGKEHLYFKVFDIILSCTSDEAAKNHFTEDFILVILKYTNTGTHSLYNGIIYKILINLFSFEDLSTTLCKSQCLFTMLVNLALGDILSQSSKDADSGCILLSNITRCQSNCEVMLNLESVLPFSSTLNKIFSVFTTVNFNEVCSLDQLAMVFCNLSQLAVVRKILTEDNQSILQNLLPFMHHESVVRRKGIVGVVHNCAFDSDKHQWMLSSNVDLLTHLLLPLAGPEEFDDEDNDKLPIDLQYLPDTKVREPDPDIRKQLLETLNQLCATRLGRQILRDKNAYIILRELHKWEPEPSTLMACENVVDILIRTEEEIGIDHLKNLEIPKGIQEEFNKEMDVKCIYP